MQIRKPIVSGQFYPAQHDSCIEEINEYLDGLISRDDLPEKITAGIVPHAGWSFSGRLAAMVFWAIKQQHEKVNTFVLFGAAHSYFGPEPAIYDRGAWLTPIGQSIIDEDLAEAILQTGLAIRDLEVHNLEHSIEVQVPFIKYLFPGAKIVPILSPPSREAVELGRRVGEIIKSDTKKKIICIGSTDLTHYGPRYGFTPMGTTAEGFRWASEVNDKEFIDLALEMQPERMLELAASRHNACGAGAAAAAVAASEVQGVRNPLLLAHTNSNEIMLKKMGTKNTDSVGYAAIVF